MLERFFWWKKKKPSFPPSFPEEPEEGFKDKQEISSLVINYLSDGVLVFSKNSILVLMNPEAEKILQVKKEEILKKHIFELNQFPALQPLVSLLGGDIRKVSRKEVEIHKRTIEITSIPLGKEIEKLGTLVVLHDITREKMVEKMKTEFITLATHQLRTPTAGIKWALRMLLDGAFGPLTKEQREIIEKAYKKNDKTILLMKDLLDVAKIEQGEMVSKMVLADIGDVVEEVIERYSEEARKKKISLEFKKPKEEMPKVMIDVNKTKIAIDNLIENAVRYTPPGGEVKISLAKGEEEIEVRIQDTGIGIPKDQQDRIFNKFFRARNAMKTETEGTGLGLYMAKYIIEAQGGSIWFESEENKGSTFYFTIPIKKEFGEYIPPELY